MIINNYIDGKDQSFSKNKIPVEDPSIGEIIAEVVLSNDDDIEHAINSSKKVKTNGLIQLL